MRSFHTYWLWLGATFVTLTVTLFGISGGFEAAKKHYSLWTAALSIAAYCLGAAAVLMFVAAVRDWKFPGVRVNSGETPDTAIKAPDIDVSFSYLRETLVIGILNREKTLNSATINVLVPKDPGITIVRKDPDGADAPNGRLLETPESLREDGVPSLYWAESKLHIPGVGTSSLLTFYVGKVSDQLPVKFKLGADELGGWYEWPGRIVVGAHQLQIVNQMVESLEGGTAPVDESRREAIEKDLLRNKLGDYLRILNDLRERKVKSPQELDAWIDEYRRVISNAEVTIRVEMSAVDEQLFRDESNVTGSGVEIFGRTDYGRYRLQLNARVQNLVALIRKLEN